MRSNAAKPAQDTCQNGLQLSSIVLVAAAVESRARWWLYLAVAQRAARGAAARNTCALCEHRRTQIGYFWWRGLRALGCQAVLARCSCDSRTHLAQIDGPKRSRLQGFDRCRNTHNCHCKNILQLTKPIVLIQVTYFD